MMAAPGRSPKSTCDTCQLRSVDFTDQTNGGVDVSAEAVLMARGISARGGARQEPGESATCEALDATRSCVTQILGGNCVKYATILDGQIVARRQRRFKRG